MASYIQNVNLKSSDFIYNLTWSNQSLPSHHLSKQDAQRSCSCCAPVHTPQVENEREVDQGGDGCPCGVESQTILDLYISPCKCTRLTSFTRVCFKKRDLSHQQCSAQMENTVRQNTKVYYTHTKLYQYSETGQVFAMVCL